MTMPGRRAYAHAAVLAAITDEGAPGAAITAELCGSWEHEPPCPLAPHHTQADHHGDELRLRVLFACEEEHEDEVRARIRRALARGVLEGPNGRRTWELREDHSAEVTQDERDHAERLARS
jgi:hypothetical protein